MRFSVRIPTDAVCPSCSAMMVGKGKETMADNTIAQLHIEHSQLTGVSQIKDVNLETVRLIKDDHGLPVSLADIPTDDADTFAMINSGNAEDIFHLAGHGIKDAAERIRVRSIQELAVLLALCRRDQTEVLEEYLRRKMGQALITYEDPLLEPVLRETCGLIVYEEQFDRILFDLAGDQTGAFGYSSLEEAGEMREALKGRAVPEVATQVERFTDGCVMKGTLTRSEAMLYFETLLEYVDRCTCRSGAITDALLVYQCAYLKTHFPKEYQTAKAAANNEDV